MPDEFFNRPPSTPPRRSGPSLRLLSTILLLTFAAGAGLVGWLAWSGKVQITKDLVIDSKPAASASFAALPSPAPSAQPAVNASASASTPATDALELRIAALEQRLTRLDLQAAAAEGNATRAEALLVALASRRAIERGAPLGPLADQLKLRFGDAQPGAVTTLIDAAGKPITLDLLAGQLDAQQDALTQAPSNEDGWSRVKRELAGLFVIRRDEAPLTKPENRLDRARLLLRSGQIDAAIREVQTMPGAAGARGWIDQATRYAMAQRALDLIETTALLEPEKLKDADGTAVKQPSPASPTPTASATPAPNGAV